MSAASTIDLTAWTPDLTRELLCVIYGGHRDSSGRWQPDTAAVARHRRVSRRTAQRWAKVLPAEQLASILDRRRPRRATLRREELQLARQHKMLRRAELGRGRGNIKEYGPQGWLDQHLVLVLEDNHRPLRRVAVVRDTSAGRRRAARGAHVVDVVLADNKFLAERTRYEILAKVQPWRLHLPATKVTEGHTQVWLAGAPLPTLPVHMDR